MSWTEDGWKDVDGDYRPVVTFVPQCCTCGKLDECPVTMMLCYRENILMCKNRVPKNQRDDYVYPPVIYPTVSAMIREDVKTYPPDLRRKTLRALERIERSA